MGTNGLTMVWIKPDTKLKLEGLRVVPRESINDVIARLIKIREEVEYVPE
jgi:hypothetical protein